MAQPIKVCVTGAAGQIAYSLLGSVAKGDVFGPDKPVILTMLDIAPMMKVLEGVKMELDDCAFPLLQEVIATDDPMVAFKGIDAAFLVGAMPRKDGMERKDLLTANVKIFKAQGDALDKVAKKSVKVLVVGNPANTNACICSNYAPSIPKDNFSCLTRLDQNRAQSQIAQFYSVPVAEVKNVIIWGNHSSTQFPDASHATVNGKPLKEVAAKGTKGDSADSFFKGDFLKTVQQRGAAVIKARGLSSAMSAAKASVDHMRDWWCGTEPGRMVSMGVLSEKGYYGVGKGLMYSYPVTISKDGKVTVVENLSIDEFAREKMEATNKELMQERDDALTATK